MTTTGKLTDEQWLIQHFEDDAEACSAVNGSKDITTKDARRAEVKVKRLIRERDDARRASQAAPAPSDGLREEPCSGTLLEWMTYHDQPLQLWREANESGISEGSWVVVDNHKGTVMGSGPTAEDALREAYTEALSASPAQAGKGPLTDRQLRDQITGENR
ncbi:hypothetical protein LZ686_00365 [Paracoccus sp. NFXS7]|uniref:hypothetical protein n=1 Tax=Paracoccus sp. NFXS7 TaxID=2908653 RepID=UPI0032DEADEB